MITKLKKIKGLRTEKLVSLITTHNTGKIISNFKSADAKVRFKTLLKDMN